MRYDLYYAPDNASLVVRLALEELGVPYRNVLIDRSSGEQRGESYRAFNPQGLLPVLVDNDNATVLFKTAAILLYLVDMHGALGPTSLKPGRGDLLKWLFFLSNTRYAYLRVAIYTQRYIAECMVGSLRVDIYKRVSGTGGGPIT